MSESASPVAYRDINTFVRRVPFTTPRRRDSVTVHGGSTCARSMRVLPELCAHLPIAILIQDMR